MVSTAATMRVLNVLRHWITNHGHDFQTDAKLHSMTMEFLEELTHNSNLLPAESREACHLLRTLVELNEKPKVNLEKLLTPPTSPWFAGGPRDTIETLSAHDIAEMMTYLDHKIFVSIRSEEFLSQAWMKEDKAVRAPHILLMTRRFNEMSSLVASEILRAPEMSRRVTVIEKWAGKCPSTAFSLDDFYL